MPIAVNPNHDRIPALDFTKGALVLFMVLYHWLNYFVAFDGGFYRYLRFLTPSFIFITGFLLSHVYLASPRYAALNVPKRLMQRALKLLAVFVFLNAARTFLIPDSRGGQAPVEAWTAQQIIAVFVTGNASLEGNARTAAFNILVPIAYLLLLSAGITASCKRCKFAFQSICSLLLLAIIALSFNQSESGNLELLAIGLLGVIVGYVPIDKFNQFARHPFLLGVAYICYAGAITVWDTPYPLQIAGVCICLAIIYSIGQRGNQSSVARSLVILLGTYSLFGYIAQIVILQVLHRMSLSLSLGGAGLAFSFLAAFAFTILTVVVLDRARARLPILDRLYKAVFA